MNEETQIRTDACPSPPRDEQKDPEVLKEIPNMKAGVSNPIPPQDLPKTRIFSSTHGKSQYTKKAAPRTKCENVIYINGSKDIHIGSTTNYTVNVAPLNNKANESTHARQKFHKTEKINKLLCSNLTVNRDHLIFLSTHIRASNWKLMARRLGSSEGQIEQLFADHHECGIKEVIYQCLLDWTRTEVAKATIARLVDVLWICDECEAVELFSHYMYSDK